MRITVQKSTAEGEAISLEFSVSNQKDLSNLANAFNICDTRLREMNERYLTALKTMEEFPLEWRVKVRYLIDCLHGHRLDQLSKIPHLRVVGKGENAEVMPDGPPSAS